MSLPACGTARRVGQPAQVAIPSAAGDKATREQPCRRKASYSQYAESHERRIHTHAQAATAHTYRANNNTIVCRTFQLASGLCRVGFIPGSLERKGRATKRLLTYTRVRSALFAPKLYTLKLFRYFPSACACQYTGCVKSRWSGTWKGASAHEKLCPIRVADTNHCFRDAVNGA